MVERPGEIDESGRGGSKILHEQTKLTQSGGGSRLYIPAGLVERFSLTPGTELDFIVEEEDGKPYLRVPFKVGFTKEQLLSYAGKQDWEITESLETGDNWKLILHNTDGTVRIRVRSKTHVGERILNNLFLEGPTLHVSNVDAYESAYMLADEYDLSISISDSEGLWERLTAAGLLKPSTPPTPDEIEPILDSFEESLTVQFVQRGSTLLTTLEDIGETVQSIKLVSDKLRQQTTERTA